MKLIGKLVSPYTRRVALALELLGRPWELLPLSVGEQAALRAFNPLGRVPALQLDDGTVLIDSLAIIDHLLEEAGPAQSLLPARGPLRRRILQDTALLNGAIEKLVAGYYETARKPAEKVHRPWIEDCNDQALSALAFLEARAGQPWLSGSEGPSLSDISLAPAFDFLDWAAPELELARRFPRLAAVAERVRALPAYAATSPGG